MYGDISGFGKFFKKKDSFIDNRTFQFHYRWTFGILIACAALISMSALYGGPPINVSVNVLHYPSRCVLGCGCFLLLIARTCFRSDNLFLKLPTGTVYVNSCAIHFFDFCNL